MKKSVVYLCAALLALSLASCGGRAQDGGSQEETEQGSGDMASGNGTGAGAESGDAGEDTAQGSQDATQGTTPDGDTGSMNYEEGWSQEMAQLRAAVVEALGEEDYWPDMAMLPDMLEMTFGLTSDMYEDYMAEMPMISANVDTLLIVRAKDDKVETVQSALEAYRETQINDTIQYPMNLGKVQASRIETIDNYVIFAQLGADTEEASESGDEAVIAKCQETNDLVIETIRAQLGQ